MRQFKTFGLQMPHLPLLSTKNPFPHKVQRLDDTQLRQLDIKLEQSEHLPLVETK